MISFRLSMYDNIVRVIVEEMNIEGLIYNLEEKIEWEKKFFNYFKGKKNKEGKEIKKSSKIKSICEMVENVYFNNYNKCISKWFKFYSWKLEIVTVDEDKF